MWIGPWEGLGERGKGFGWIGKARSFDKNHGRGIRLGWVYYLEQKYIGKIIIRLLIHQMTRKNIIWSLRFFVCILWTTITAQIIFICSWRRILRKDDVVFPHTLRAEFFYPYQTMCDTFSITAYSPTIWSITKFGVTMEMTRRSYGISVAALKLDNNLKLTKK